jgi:hypothetical protein
MLSAWRAHEQNGAQASSGHEILVVDDALLIAAGLMKNIGRTRNPGAAHQALYTKTLPELG